MRTRSRYGKLTGIGVAILLAAVTVSPAVRLYLTARSVIVRPHLPA